MSEIFNEGFWKRCNSCKQEIGYKRTYWVCNVSTCNRKRTGLNFCTVSCWDAHLPMMNHREAWSEEKTSPDKETWKKICAGEIEETPRKRTEKVVEAEVAKPVSTTPKVIVRRKI